MPKRTRKPGFTLLEVLLAAALTAVLLGSLCWAIDLYVRLVDAGRTRVAQMQLARAVLNRMAEDLRGAVYPAPVDTSAVQQLAGGGAGAASGSGEQSGEQGGGGQTGGGESNGGAGGGGSSGGGGTGGTGAGGTGGSGGGSQTGEEQPPAEEPAAEPEPISTTSTPASVPGVYGDVDILQIDVSRLPRPDEYYAMPDPVTGAIRPPHDVRTVTYYLDTQQSDGKTTRGLIRREVIRAAGLYAGTQGQTASAADDQILAPEIIGLELSYFDGTEWLTTWDASVNKGLPLAVEIAIEVVAEPQFKPATALGSLLTAANTEPTTEIYRLIVDLPAAQPQPAEETTTTETESTDTSQQSGTGTQTGAPM